MYLEGMSEAIGCLQAVAATVVKRGAMLILRSILDL
jgi:hypothetical protein